MEKRLIINDYKDKKSYLKSKKGFVWFAVMVGVMVLFSAFVSADISEIAKIMASDNESGDFFGGSVSISSDGNTAIVGAVSEDTGGTYAGAAYIFVWNGTMWEEQQKIQATNTQEYYCFGNSVSISSDGNTAIIGSYCQAAGAGVYNVGAAYLFTRSGNTWTEQQKIMASDAEEDDNFGYSVSISSDGNTAIVGAYREDTGGSSAGAAYIFKVDGTTWTQQAKIQADDKQASDNFGYSVSISSSGNTSIVGAYSEDTGGSNAGAAYIFRLDGTWIQQGKILASDNESGDSFGYSVSISSDGNSAIVGASYEDTGATNAGAAYIFRWDNATWIEQAKIQASDKQASDFFGYSVSISSDGNHAIVGAYYEDTGSTDAGAAYMFRWTGTTWIEQAKIQASDKQENDRFGNSVSISSDGNTSIVGAYSEDTGGSDAGAVYIFKDEVSVPIYTEFEGYGSTTNFSDPEIDLTNVSDVVLENEYAKIEWPGSGYDVDGMDIDSNMEFLNNYVYVNSDELSAFNNSANITMAGVSYSDITSFNVMKDGQICNSPDCVKLSASPVKFEVTSFSNYTTNSTGAVIPEFSTITLIFGLIAVLIGLIIFRWKR